MKEDCFAYYKTNSGEEKCSALEEPCECKGCKFYKSKEHYLLQLQKAENRRKSLKLTEV